MINEVDVDGSGYLEFPEFCMMMHKKLNDSDQENELKEVFRVFGKDETGNLPFVNFIKVFPARFSYEHHFGSFFLVMFGLVPKFCTKKRTKKR